jgi:hypothetical protein
MKDSRNNMIVLYVSLIFFIITGLLLLTLCQDEASPAVNADNEDWEKVINGLFSLRNDCVLKQETDLLKTIFLTSEKNGRWAYESEVQRAKYLSDWSVKQGIEVSGIDSKIKIKSVKQVGRGYAFYLISANEYRYAYKDDPETENMFRLGGYHSLDLIPNEDGEGWIISREWYDDPLLDSINLENYTEEMTEYIISHPPIDLSGISEQRMTAVEYADMYCGAASDGRNDYEYNSEYTNYNPLGGDCANFASQILHAAGFKKNGTWNYAGGKGSRAWVNAQGLKDYLLYSGRASLLASGSYKEIYQYAYSMRPGDIVAYVKKGKVTHVSVVTGADSKGYPLVSCHNLDRYRVPWDIGWSGDKVKYFLLNVSY